ncbi:hypothetical protein [Antrihabitans sp. YC2-6]|uniref:hypothetical protein n=1 Tax=Antrihabitans sp. YC2-6 TaxID=2799498 RepID=UPI0018F58FA9|nr:hypothetical protein [Antrihabitans sp. YC2-6]MBJ8343109.1 hypothetical protein [Antrihabitans sp. YC2-6]
MTTYSIPNSDCRMVVGVPSEDPELWAAYLAGALDTYRKFGVESALEFEEIRDGSSTSMFLVAISPDGEVVGGVRAQGPYAVADDSHALLEWDGCPGQADLYDMIADRIPEGVVEMKAAWVSDRCPDRKAITHSLARIPRIAVMSRLDARYVIATAGTDPVIKLWVSAGGVIASHIPTAPYPSAQYHATPIWWDRSDFVDDPAIAA